MNILLLADVPPMPSITTGFGRVAGHLAKALHDAGNQVTQLALNYHDEPHNYPWQLVAPPPNDPLGNDWLVEAMRSPWEAVVALNDAWVLRRWHSIIHSVAINLGTDPAPFYGYFPVDCDGWPSELVDTMHLWAGVATYAQYGVDVVRAAGYSGPIAIIPHGQEPGLAQENLRHALPQSLGPSPWLVLRTDVNRRRKRYDLTISEFCEFAKDKPLPPHPRAPILWLHCADEGDDLPVREWYSRCLERTGFTFAQRPLLRSANASTPWEHPHVPDDVLKRLYATADVYLTTTEAEGWGLCMTEAAQQGALVIAGDNSVLSELWHDCALLVPQCGVRAESFGISQLDKDGNIYQKRLVLNYPVHPIGGYARALDRAYRDNARVRHLRKAGLEKWRFNPAYDWNRIEALFQDWVCASKL